MSLESCGDIAVAANSTLTLYTVNLSKVCVHCTLYSKLCPHWKKNLPATAVEILNIPTQRFKIKCFKSILPVFFVV